MGQVTVIINNRDLLEWPKKMCADIERMAGLHEIIIVDNGSGNRQLLQWYKDCKYKVVFLDNLGHTAPWDCGLINRIETDLYVVTDPDLDLSTVPDNALIHMANILYKSPALGKVGLLLETNGISPASPYFEHVNNYEKKIISGGVVDNLFINAPVDTTFAIYDRRLLNKYQICGARTLAPYVAKHIPWHIIEPEGEFRYYLDNASSKSSSYKWFTNYQTEGPLRALYREHKGKKVSKSDVCFPVYEKWLGPYKDHPIKMLEIGVREGGSLEIWAKYFKNAELILGCDKNPAVANLTFDDARIKLALGIASQKPAIDQILEHAKGGFDFIIDNGSHRSLDTIANFLMLFPLLRPGGLFVVEGMQHAYQTEYDGGYFNHRSAASFFRAVFDLVNVEHFRNDMTAEKLFQTFFTNAKLPEVLTNRSIGGVAAYDSMIVLEKIV
jgi:hypothetical protein